MAILGGSPLGLINVTAGPLNGYTSFNSKNERNIAVDRYNKGDGRAAGRGNSIFTGGRIVRAWPEMKSFESTFAGVPDQEGAQTTEQFKFNPRTQKEPEYQQRKNLHNNDVYDISLVNIIEHMSNTNGTLKMADFAYLKDLGVYPNNRLMIARRYAFATTDNIVRKKNKKDVGPLATLISWRPESEDFISFTFGEKWEEAEASFKDILDSIGGDISSRLGNAGGILEGAGGALPLPGVTEIFQRQFLIRLGVFEETGVMIPSGNPNLIKEAKRRTTIGYDTAGAGLDCKVNIQMTCEYEQKFISGLDPTIVWMDILGNIVRFGTSPSVSYGLSSKFGGTIQSLLNNPMAMVINIVGKIKEALTDVVSSVRDYLAEKLKEIREKKDAMDKKEEKGKEETTEGKDETTLLEEAKKAVEATANTVIKKVKSFISDALRGLAYKYRIRIMGVVQALSGAPSTPWHITIGNPLRPMFCAGDMYTQEVTLSMGPTLAFNDLPSSIKVSFSLQNARSWGLQEIMAKFNSGYLRTVDVSKTFYETVVQYKTKGNNADQSDFNIDPMGGMPYEYDYKVADNKEEEKKQESPTNDLSKPGGSEGSKGSSGSDGSKGSSGSKGTEGTITSEIKDTKNTEVKDLNSENNAMKIIQADLKTGNPQEKTTETDAALGKNDVVQQQESVDDILSSLSSDGSKYAQTEQNANRTLDELGIDNPYFRNTVRENVSKVVGDQPPK